MQFFPKNTFFYLLLLTLLACGATPASTSAPEHPNVLFILTDDQGIGDLSLHGNPILETPATDQLLRESYRFNRFYVSPVCAPTRASFLSGQYAHRNGAFFVTRRAETMSDSVLTIAEVLKTSGYHSGLFGKWHNGATYPYNPAGQGFDKFLGFCMGHYNNYYDYFLEDEKGEEIPFGGYITDVLTDAAFDFMRAKEATKQPFFCMLTLPAPHTPVQGPQKLFEKYKGGELDEYTAGIYAMVEANDLAIGRLLDSMRNLNLLDNTIVIFSTDNGPNGDRFNLNLRGRKGQVDEGGVRVPFGIRLPGKANETSEIDQVAAHIDLLPTLAELTNTPLPVNIQQLDGKSLVPLLQSDDPAWPDRYIYAFKQGYEFSPFPGSMRNQEQVYVLRNVGQSELYDLKTDPGQSHNIFDANRPEHQKLVADYLKFAATVPRPGLVAPPIEIGHPAAKLVRLLAHEGHPFGAARFHDQYGWANDWVENIRDDQSGISWPLRVIDDGIYFLEVEYAFTGKAGPETSVLLNFANKRRNLIIEEFPNADILVKDLVPRKEVYPREWRVVKNNVSLPAGLYDFKVAGLIDQQQGQEETGELMIKSVTLKRVR